MNSIILQPAEPSFWFNAAIFLVSCIVCFFIPGFTVLSRLRLKPFNLLTHSFVVGYVFFALQSFLFSLLDLRVLSYAYLSLFAVIFALNFGTFRQTLLQIKKVAIDKVLLAILCLGMLVQLIAITPMGLKTEKGMAFCCGLPDSLYHIALTYELTQRVPPIEPGIAGVVVKNYYYLTNLVYADLIRIFRLPLVQTQAEYGQIFFTFVFIVSLWSLLNSLNLKRGIKLWILFFTLFQSDIVYLFLAMLGRGLDLKVRVLHDVTNLWFSPPRVYSAIILLSSLDLLLHWFKNKTIWLTVILGVLFGSLIGFKIYTSIFALFGLGVLTLVYIKRKDFSLVPLLTLSLLVSLVLYLPVNSSSHASFAFNGLWRFENFFADPTTVNFVKVESARLKFLAGNNYILVGIIEVFYFLGYNILVFGTLVFGLLQTKKTFKFLPKDFNIFVLSGIALSLMLGYFFVQRPGYANTSQFLITTEIMAVFYVGIAVWYWLGKLKSSYRIILAVLIVGLTATKPLMISGQHLVDRINKQGYILSNNHLAALEYLRTETPRNSIILIDRHLTWENLEYQMRFLSERRFYLLGKNILEDHGVAFSPRYELIKSIEKQQGIDARYIELKKNSITHIWYRKDVPAISSVFLKKYGKKVYENKKIVIFELVSQK